MPTDEPDQAPRSSAQPLIGVVTVSYGSADALRVFLATLRETEQPSLPVVVVDNKPGVDGVSEVAETFGAHYLALPDNPGYGAGMNAGVAELERRYSDARFDAYFFCNPDIKFLSNVSQPLAEIMLNDPKIGSIAPMLRNTDGSVYPSARNIPSIATGVGHAFFAKIWPTNPWTRSYQVADSYTESRPAGSLSGAAVMVRRSTFEQIQGWDEEYFLHFEDIDLGWRIGQHGYLNYYVPEYALEHAGGHSTAQHTAVAEQAMTDSAIRFLGKRYPGKRNFALRYLLAVGLKTRGVLRLRSQTASHKQ